MVESNSKRLDIIYHNGMPDGVRSIRRHLSTMTTYVIPRTMLTEAKKIRGIERPGIYYLINEDKNNNIAQLYIGQTRNGISRLDDHNRSKDFWNKAIMFLSDKQTFSLDIIAGLEQYAIKKAQESKRYTVENGVNPKYEIDEYDYVSIEEIYDEIQFVMATLGYRLNKGADSDNQDQILHTTRNGINGLGYYCGERFDVLEGSEIDLGKKVKIDSYNKLRAKLKDEDVIVMENGKYILKKTVSFKTPSGASDFVLGGSTNGWTEWKNSSEKSLDELYRQGS